MKKRIFQKAYNKLLNRFNNYLLTINFTTKKVELNKDEKFLCIAPHPDDETFGLGGTLTKYGKNFDVICLTNGAKGIKNQNVNEIIKIRKEEFENALENYNLNSFSNLGIEDKKVFYSYEQFKKIDIKKYDRIFIPNLIDTHIDHRACFLHLCKMLKENKYKSNLKIYFYEIWGALASPNVIIDISDNIETKIKAIECYKSQLERKDYKSAILGLNKFRGLTKNIPYSEAFMELSPKEALDIYKTVLSNEAITNIKEEEVE